jgi:hypothetical protein
MAREKFIDKPFFYKLLSGLLRGAGAIVVILVIIFAVRFFSGTPFYRLFDGISTSAIVRMGIILVVVLTLFISFWKTLGGGIATFILITVYTALESFEMHAYTAGAINYIVLGISLMYIIMGILKRYLEHDRMEDIMGPRIEKNEGPDLMDLHL